MVGGGVGQRMRRQRTQRWRRWKRRVGVRAGRDGGASETGALWSGSG